MIVDLAGNDFKVVGASAVTVWHVTHGLTVPTSASARSPPPCTSLDRKPLAHQRYPNTLQCWKAQSQYRDSRCNVGEPRLVLMRAPQWCHEGERTKWTAGLLRNTCSGIRVIAPVFQGEPVEFDSGRYGAHCPAAVKMTRMVATQRLSTPGYNQVRHVTFVVVPW